MKHRDEFIAESGYEPRVRQLRASMRTSRLSCRDLAIHCFVKIELIRAAIPTAKKKEEEEKKTLSFGQLAFFDTLSSPRPPESCKVVEGGWEDESMKGGKGRQQEGLARESRLKGGNGKTAFQGITGAIKRAETAAFSFNYRISIKPGGSI